MVHNIRVIIVADDLTGAMDTASPFARRGANTRVVCDRHDLAKALEQPVDVLSINTETRHVNEAEAAAVVADVTRQACACKPEVLLKKIDSTLRGNVAVETKAMLAAGERTSAVITPAMPTQGRTVRDGLVYIDGVLLAETPIGRDKLSPPPREPMAGVFSGIDCLIPDCATQEELDLIARHVMATPSDTLAVGAGGLGAALADHLFGTQQVAPNLNIEKGPLLFVVGSRTPLAANQIERLEAAFPNRVSRHSPGQDEVTAMGDYIVLTPPAKDGDARQVAVDLARTAAHLIAEKKPSAMLLTGGDTALAVLNELGRSVLDVLGEVLPGIALSRIELDGCLIPVVTKAGGFGNDALFVDVSAFF